MREIEFNKIIKEESDCNECTHRDLCCTLRRTPGCRFDFIKLCENYSLSRSGGDYDCDECIHRFTRWGNKKIPCFSCRFFEKEKKE